MKKFKDFLQEADIIKFPGSKKPETPKGPPIQTLSKEEIKAHADEVENKVNSLIKASGKHLETPTLVSSYGTDRRSHPDIYTQLHDHIFRPSSEIDSNPEIAEKKKQFAIQHYKANRDSIHKNIDSTLETLNRSRENDLDNVQGRTHDVMIRRAYDIPMTSLQRTQERLKTLDE